MGARPHKDEKPSANRVRWYMFHRCLGALTVILGFTNCFLGSEEIVRTALPQYAIAAGQTKTTILTLTSILFVIWLIIFFVAKFTGYKTYVSEPAKKDEEDPEEEKTKEQLEEE